MKGHRHQGAMAEMDLELENARAAWRWAAEKGQIARLDGAAEGLCFFFVWRVRHQEGEAACRLAADRLEAIVSDPEPAPSATGMERDRRAEGLRVWARILSWHGYFSLMLGHIELARQLLEQSLALLRKLAESDKEPNMWDAGRDLGLERGVTENLALEMMSQGLLEMVSLSGLEETMPGGERCNEYLLL